MKSNQSIALFGFLAVFAFGTVLSSCQKENLISSNELKSSVASERGETSNAKRKRKKDNEDPPPPPVSDPFVVTYQLYEVDDYDPLFKFSISQSGHLMLLETDPTITSWGTNYWGYWSDPFPYMNNEVNYIVGLTNTTYRFTPLPGNKIDVTKTLIVQPYPSGTPTTTVTHPGVYMLAN